VGILVVGVGGMGGLVGGVVRVWGGVYEVGGGGGRGGGGVVGVGHFSLHSHPSSGKDMQRASQQVVGKSWRQGRRNARFRPRGARVN